ncbi:MAG: hypothetical protein AAF086_09975 [Planctomycetota bacterium]
MKNPLLAAVVVMIFTGLPGGTASCEAGTLFLDTFNRSSFDAASNGWAIQTHAQGKGTFGRIPPMVAANRRARFAINVASNGVITQTSTRTNATYTRPTNSSDYVEFIASLRISSAAVQQDGLLFAISVYGADANGQDAINMEFVTEQINSGSNAVPYDRVLISSYNDYTGGSTGKWVQYVETSQRADLSSFVTYKMRLYRDRVDYLANGNIFATYVGSYIPDGDMKFVLTTWAPSSSWPTAESYLANSTYHYMDVDWAKVVYFDH